MDNIIFSRISKMLSELQSIGANTSEFEEELNNLCLRLAQYKAAYERNEVN